MNRRRWMVVAVVVAVLIAAALYLRGRPKDAPKFETAELDRGSIVARITATGTLSALVTVQVGSQVSGRIAELGADFNSQVKKGQRIAKIDPQLFTAALSQSRANYTAAVANLAKAKVQALDAQRQADRAKTLREKNLIAQADLDTAQANADAAKAQVASSASSVEQSRASLQLAEVNLAYTDIFSPIDGQVISRSVDVGQTVAASLSAPTLFTIAGDLRNMQVHTSVAEADVGKLAEGMPATFRVDAYPAEEFQGVISQIRNSPQTVQNVVTYDAVIDVKNEELKLRPGMTANVTVVYARRDDVVRVPNAAMRFRPPADLLASLRAGRGGAGDAASSPGGSAGSTGGAQPGHWGGRGDGGTRWGGGGEGGGRWGGADGGTRRMRPEGDGSARGPGWGGGQPGAGGGAMGAGGGPSAVDQKTVWVLRDNQPGPVRFRAGVTDGSFTEALGDGLHPGDQVITDISDPGAAPPSRPAGAPGAPGGGGMRGGRMF